MTAVDPASERQARATGMSPGGGPLLAVRNLTKHFPIRDGVLQRVTGHVRAVDGVSFDLERGTTLGLVGESGCGKTTLGRLVAGLAAPTSGGVYVDLDPGTDARLTQAQGLDQEPGAAEDGGANEALLAIDDRHRIDRLKGDAARRYRRNCQLVFQDSYSSLNPRHLVRDIVGRPLRVHKEASGSALTERVVELLELVGLGRQHLYRYPHQFSGGQRQRISIARALALDPELIILDEPTSALDVSVQAQILNLLHELQVERGLTYLFISHDLAVVRHAAERIVVMYVGRVAELGGTEQLFDRPLHPYTHALLQASPEVDAGDGDDGFRGLEGTVPDPARPPSGCRFHTRCANATVDCGWEIDDVVRQLEDDPAKFERLVGVERSSDFAAKLRFDDEASAQALAAAIRADVPAAMVGAIDHLEVSEQTVDVRFRPVSEIEIAERGDGRQVACILDDFDPS